MEAIESKFSDPAVELELRFKNLLKQAQLIVSIYPELIKLKIRALLFKAIVGICFLTLILSFLFTSVTHLFSGCVAVVASTFDITPGLSNIICGFAGLFGLSFAMGLAIFSIQFFSLKNLRSKYEKPNETA